MVYQYVRNIAVQYLFVEIEIIFISFYDEYVLVNEIINKFKNGVNPYKRNNIYLKRFRIVCYVFLIRLCTY